MAGGSGAKGVWGLVGGGGVAGCTSNPGVATEVIDRARSMHAISRIGGVGDRRNGGVVRVVAEGCSVGVQFVYSHCPILLEIHPRFCVD